MTQQTQTSSRSARFAVAFFRLLLFAVIVAIITAAIYLAAPYIYQTLILPVQNTQVAVERLQRAQTQLAEELRQEMTGQEARVTQLESDMVVERGLRSELEAYFVQQTQTISGQTTRQDELAGQLDQQVETFANLEQRLNTLETGLADLDTSLAEVEQAVESPEAAVESLRRQLLLLQAGQGVLKTRLHLTENNAGQAQTTLEEVRAQIEQLRNLTSPGQRGDIAEIEAQLETVTTAIEEQPFIALQELEILWELLQAYQSEASN